MMGLISFILVLLSPLAFAAFAILCWFIIDTWVDIIFKPFENLQRTMYNYKMRKELEILLEERESENSQEDDK